MGRSNLGEGGANLLAKFLPKLHGNERSRTGGLRSVPMDPSMTTGKIVWKKITLNFYRTLHWQSTDTNHEESLSAILGSETLKVTTAMTKITWRNRTDPITSARRNYLETRHLTNLTFGTSFKMTKYNITDVYSGGSRGSEERTSPSQSNCFSLSCRFRQKLCQIIVSAYLGLADPSGKSCVRHLCNGPKLSVQGCFLFFASSILIRQNQKM